MIDEEGIKAIEALNRQIHVKNELIVEKDVELTIKQNKIKQLSKELHQLRLNQIAPWQNNNQLATILNL